METVFVGLDCIYDIACKGGEMPTSANHVASNRVIEKADAAIKFARDSGYIAVHVKVESSPNYVECPASFTIFSGNLL